MPRGGDLWQNAYNASGSLDLYAEKMITEPSFHKLVRLESGGQLIFWHLSGPDTLRKACKVGTQCTWSSNGVTHIYTLAGPLPNGNTYISQWGIGHEWAHVLGIDVDRLLASDKEHPLNIFLQ